jgi:hypothetical protein
VANWQTAAPRPIEAAPIGRCRAPRSRKKDLPTEASRGLAARSPEVFGKSGPSPCPCLYNRSGTGQAADLLCVLPLMLRLAAAGRWSRAGPPAAQSWLRRFAVRPLCVRRGWGNCGKGRNGHRKANRQNLPRLWPFSYLGRAACRLTSVTEAEDKPAPSGSPALCGCRPSAVGYRPACPKVCSGR